MLQQAETWMRDINKKHTMTMGKAEKILDIAAIAAVLQYAFFRFLQSTMFQIEFSNRYKIATTIFLILAGVSRFSLILIKELGSSDNASSRKCIFLRVSVMLLLFLPFLYVAKIHDYKVLVYLPLCAICTYRMNIEKILKPYVIVLGVAVVATMLSCLTGTVRNLAEPEGVNITESFGFINKTDFASYFTYFILFAWCFIRNRNWQIGILLSLVALAVSYGIFYLTGSRTALYCGILSGVFIAWDTVYSTLLHRNRCARMINRMLGGLSVIGFILIAAIFLILLLLYAGQNSIALQIDRLLSGRLSQTLDSYRMYGVKLFGSTIETMHGGGGTNIAWGWRVNGYGYLDVAYAMMGIRYGILIMVLILGIFASLSVRAIRAGKNRVALTLIVIALHAFSEARCLDVNYNILLFIPFCSMNGEDLTVRSATETTDLFQEGNKQKKLILATVPAVIVLCICLYFPRLLSQLRTLFAALGWHNGFRANYSFITCAVLVTLTVIILKIIRDWIVFGKKIQAVIILSTLLCMAGMTIWGNNIIEKAVDDSHSRLETEETVIRKVEAAAEMPVYAAEMSEIYQRRFGGIHDRAFTVEGLYRKPQGSILTDSTTEVAGIEYTGCMYLQFSDWSGIYSYDKAVIEALSAEGYEWKPFYYSKRSCDLDDLAKLNGLDQDKNGHVILEGPDHSIYRNTELDQFAGSYEVYVDLSLLSMDRNQGKPVCTIRVMGEAGDFLIKEEKIHLDDFDSSGQCKKTIPYGILSVPKVFYVVIAEEGVRLSVNEMTWRKVSLPES